FCSLCTAVFLFTAPPTTEIYTLSLHDALPIFGTQQNSVFIFKQGACCCFQCTRGVLRLLLTLLQTSVTDHTQPYSRVFERFLLPVYEMDTVQAEVPYLVIEGIPLLDQLLPGLPCNRFLCLAYRLGKPMKPLDEKISELAGRDGIPVSDHFADRFIGRMAYAGKDRNGEPGDSSR